MYQSHGWYGLYDYIPDVYVVTTTELPGNCPIHPGALGTWMCRTGNRAQKRQHEGPLKRDVFLLQNGSLLGGMNLVQKSSENIGIYRVFHLAMAAHSLFFWRGGLTYLVAIVQDGHTFFVDHASWFFLTLNVLTIMLCNMVPNVLFVWYLDFEPKRYSRSPPLDKAGFTWTLSSRPVMVNDTLSFFQ